MFSLKKIHEIVEDAPFGRLTNIQLQLQYHEILLLTDLIEKMTGVLEKLDQLIKPKITIPPKEGFWQTDQYSTPASIPPKGGSKYAKSKGE